MTNKKSLDKGIIFALLTAIISGISIFYAKIAVVKISPLVLTTSRNLWVAFLFLVYFIFSKKLKNIKALKKNELINLTLVGLIGGALPFYLFFTGLSVIGAQTANFIHKSLFIWVSLLAYIFLKEKLNLNYWLAFILIFIANFFLMPFKFDFNRGELMVFSATLLWAAENILAKKILSRVSSETVGLFRMTVGSLILLLLLSINSQLNRLLAINNQQLVAIILGGSILFFYVYFWYKALKYAPASLVTLILTFSVVVGNILTGSFTNIRILPKEILYSTLTIIALISILTSFYTKHRISKSKIFNI